ncbi:MAG: prephenate dehydrogenase [Ruminococcaceae bacterium]|nr:prephenate dehydrogenase [Oscillospiraceae bacterium]
MKVGIVGLGLIGGSLAKAYSESEIAEVYGCDRDGLTEDFALMAKAIKGKLTKDNIPECDLILIAVYPGAVVEYVKENAEYFGKNTLVIDCAGTKTHVCGEIFPIAEKYGFTFLGGHPMAGTQFSGFKYSRSDMFKGAPMIIVPPVFDDIALLQWAKELLAPAGFGHISVTTAEEHDRLIAFTSQLAHVVSNAYVKSPSAQSHKGFSAGSYKDMTRVAWLDPNMWTELFLENKKYLLDELDIIINSLKEYREAIAGDEKDRLRGLLLDGKLKKEAADGK